MRSFFLRLILASLLPVSLAGVSAAQGRAAVDEAVSLDSCRAMAMANNKQMRIQAERIKAAGYQKKEAFAAYLPSIDFAGEFMLINLKRKINGTEAMQKGVKMSNFDGARRVVEYVNYYLKNYYGYYLL